MSSVEPLFLPAASKQETTQLPEEIPCILCNTSFLVEKTQNYQNILKHLLIEHKFVISNFGNIAYPARYLEYWRNKFQGNVHATDVCAVINTNTGEFDAGEREHYYLLSDTLPEDASLRKKLCMKKLEAILSHQEKERCNLLSKRMCLFCKKVHEQNRAALLNHMARDHNFSVGRPENLVYIDELLDLLEDKLKNLQCLYCERTFKDWQTLKEHMRKKQHKQINPHNMVYDKYYIINYVDPITPGADAATTEAHDSDTEEVEWKDWEEQEDANMICLFCTDARPTLDSIGKHMKDTHKFDLPGATKGLDFYQQIKLINFIRKQMYLHICFVCSKKFPSHHDLVVHLSSMEHENNYVDALLWDQPQYYFPTYENDQLLWALEVESGDISADEKYVVPEDIVVPDQTVLRVLTEPEAQSEAPAL